MSEYVIVSDSTTDLTKELIEQKELSIIPMEFSIDQNSYFDNPYNVQLKATDFYDQLRMGKIAITSQINSARYTDFFEPFLKEGKDVLFLSFSSALSGTYQSSCIACEDLKEKYPNRKIISVDTKSASMGEGLLVFHAATKKKEGLTIEQLAQWVKEHRLNLCHWFTVDDLNHLKRGGRISPTAALVGTFLGIKPILHVDDEGCLIPVSKIRGRRQSLDALVEQMEDTYDKSFRQTVFISHGDSLDDAKYIEKKVRKKFDVQDIVISTIGPVIGSHSGPGTLALFFMGSKR